MQYNKLYENLKSDICNIILKTDAKLIFLIGDNSTGKTEIGNALKGNNDICVMDNYRGNLIDVDSSKKTVIITHYIDLLLTAPSLSKVIITQTNDIYVSTVCDDFHTHEDIVTMMYNKNPLGAFLNNALANNWSELNQKLLDEYIEKNSSSLDVATNLIIDTIKRYINN